VTTASFDDGEQVLVRRPDGGGSELVRAFEGWYPGKDDIPNPLPRASRRSRYVPAQASRARKISAALAQSEAQPEQVVVEEEVNGAA
jgi:hypothetical protein